LPAGFYTALTLKDWKKAKQHPDLMMVSSTFKTAGTEVSLSQVFLIYQPPPPPPAFPSGTWGYKALQLNTAIITIIDAYVSHVRPHCYPNSGVVTVVSTKSAAPLFVRPARGSQLPKTSPYIAPFFQRHINKRLTSTRLRQMIHTTGPFNNPLRKHSSHPLPLSQFEMHPE
jgi:hypothetical protein